MPESEDLSPELLEEYEAATRGVAWRELSSARGKIRVQGPDYLSFLQAMISNEVVSLGDGSAAYGTLLTATGKIVSDFHYYRLPGWVMLDVARERLDILLETLSGYVIMDEVELGDVTSRWAHLAVHGNRSRELLQLVVDGELPVEGNRLAMSGRGDGEILVIRRNPAAEGEYHLICADAQRDALLERLLEMGRSFGLRTIGPETVDLLRLEAGIPWFGRDFAERNNPVEIRLHSAYSLSKGCYPGQEVVAKATHIGGVARHLVRLNLEPGAELKNASKLFERGGSEVGWVTSCAWSPRFQHPIALGFVRRAFSEPGQELELVGPEGRRGAAKVVESFT